MGVTNAVTVDADADIAPITLVGPGAGGMRDRRRRSWPILATSRAACAPRRSAVRPRVLTTSKKAPMQRHEGGYYIRLLAVDKPGTAATIAKRLAAAAHLARIHRAAPP